jgi:acetyltransferase-like isoleucine patch superfamily enzyme
MGEGNIICAGNILTCNIVIGNYVTINLTCTIAHDDIIEDFVTILPGCNISGNVHLKRKVDVGTKTAIIPGVVVGENTIIGAGSTVINDLPANCTAVGTPAKPIKFHKQWI